MESIDLYAANGVDNEEPRRFVTVLGREGVDVTDEAGGSNFRWGVDNILNALVSVAGE